jgi:hypothetical protein
VGPRTGLYDVEKIPTPGLEMSPLVLPAWPTAVSRLYLSCVSTLIFFVFYTVHVVSKESRRFILPITTSRDMNAVGLC